ncbi:MAG TPA: DUF6306 domain-containing protein, partial [Thermomicrobiales bacterium]|nr:DUF6306 domain-containing protein [Thermomicrobiales bacterium]
TDVFHINWPRGAFVRVLDNSVTRGERGDPFDPGAAVEIAMEERRPIKLFSTDSPLQTTSGDLEAMPLYAGEGSARIREIAKAGDLVRAVAAQAQALLDPAAATGPVAHERASPVCYASEASAGYNGEAQREEIVTALEELLQAERAGARVAALTAREMGEDDGRALLADIRHDEARWCAMLIASLRRLDATPSTEVGAFEGKAMAISDAGARLAFLNKGQDWVVRRLEKLIPRIQDDRLRDDLARMRVAHVANIERAAAFLAGRPAEAAHKS